MPKPLLPSRRDAKTVASTAPFASTAGPPEFPCRTLPRTLVIVRSTGPCPYASRAQDGGRPSDPSGDRGERAVAGKAEDRHRVAGLRVGDRERRGAKARHGQDREVVLAVEDHGASGEVRPDPGRLHRRVVLPGDDVRRGDHQAAADDPAASGDTEAAGRSKDANNARRRTPHRRIAQYARVGEPRPDRTARRSAGTGPRARARPAAVRAERRRSGCGGRRKPARPSARRSALGPGARPRRRSRPARALRARRAAHPRGCRAHEAAARRAPRARPGRPSSRRSRARSRRRTRRRARRAASRATGIHPKGARAPGGAPSIAPATIPTRESALPTSPFRSPTSAANATTPSAIQSTFVTRPG